MNVGKAILAVFRKEMWELARNRVVLLSLFAPVLLSLAFVRIAERHHEVRLRLCLARPVPAALMELLEGCEALELQQVSGEEELRERVERTRADLGLWLSDDFAEAIAAGQQPQVRVFVREDRGPLVAAGLSAVVEVLRRYAHQEAPVEVELTTLGASAERVLHAKLVASWVLFVLLVGFTMVAAGVIEEREKGTLQAILVTSTRLETFMLGKALAGFVVTLALGLLMLGLHKGLDAGWLATLGTLTVGTAFVIAVGVWMGTLFENLASANASLSLAFMVLFVPVYLADLDLSGQVQSYVAVLPSYALQHGLELCLQGAGVKILPYCTSLLAWTTGVGLAGWLGLRRLVC